MAEIKDENGRKERLYLFYDGESVTGKVSCFYEQKYKVVKKLFVITVANLLHCGSAISIDEQRKL